MTHANNERILSQLTGNAGRLATVLLVTTGLLAAATVAQSNDERNVKRLAATEVENFPRKPTNSSWLKLTTVDDTASNKSGAVLFGVLDGALAGAAVLLTLGLGLVLLRLRLQRTKVVNYELRVRSDSNDSYHNVNNSAMESEELAIGMSRTTVQTSTPVSESMTAAKSPDSMTTTNNVNDSQYNLSQTTHSVVLTPDCRSTVKLNQDKLMSQGKSKVKSIRPVEQAPLPMPKNSLKDDGVKIHGRYCFMAQPVSESEETRAPTVYDPTTSIHNTTGQPTDRTRAPASLELLRSGKSAKTYGRSSQQAYMKTANSIGQTPTNPKNKSTILPPKSFIQHTKSVGLTTAKYSLKDNQPPSLH